MIAGLLKSMRMFLISKDGAVKNLFSIFAYPRCPCTRQIYNLHLRIKLKEPLKPKLHCMAEKNHCICKSDGLTAALSCLVQNILQRVRA